MKKIIEEESEVAWTEVILIDDIIKQNVKCMFVIDKKKPTNQTNKQINKQN